MTCDYSIDYEYGVELDDGYTITAKPYSKKETEYVFYENQHQKSKLTHSRQPEELTLKDKVGSEIKKHMNTKDFKKHVDNGIFIGGMFRFVYKRDCCCFSYSCSSSPFNFRHLRRKQ